MKIILFLMDVVWRELFVIRVSDDIIVVKKLRLVLLPNLFYLLV